MTKSNKVGIFRPVRMFTDLGTLKDLYENCQFHHIFHSTSSSNSLHISLPLSLCLTLCIALILCIAILQNEFTESLKSVRKIFNKTVLNGHKLFHSNFQKKMASNDQIACLACLVLSVCFSIFSRVHITL